MSIWKRTHDMGWAAFIMGTSILLSRFMGLIRDKTISYFFGATRESDVYFAAFVIPDFINYLLAGAYFSITLIPLLAAYFGEDEEDGWKFFSSVFNWIAVVITLLTAVASVFAHQLAYLAAPGLDPDGLDRLALFLRIIMPAQICFLLGSCISAVLYLRKQFLVPALTPLIYNLAIIAGGVLMRSRGMVGFCWGVLAGAFVGNFLLPYIAAAKGGGINLRLSFSHPGLKRFVLLALPLMIGQSIVVLDEQLIRIFGSLAGVGAISWLNYSRRIMLVPVGVVAQAAGVASFPFLAELFARKEFSRFTRTLNSALQGVMVLLVPLSLWMIVVAEPTVTLIFQQGRFGAADSRETARLLQIMLLAVFCWGFQQIIGRGFYARRDTLTPAVIGTAVMLVCVPLFAVLTRAFGVKGVAAASAASIALYTAVLSFWWVRRFGKETFAGLGRATAKIGAIALFACIPAHFAATFRFAILDGHPYWGAFFAIVASGFCFLAAFLVPAAVLAPALVRPLLEKAGPLGARLLNR